MHERLIAVGGGKGGVGKSVITLCLGRALAMYGKSTTIVDLDLGASTLHTLLGHRTTLCGIGEFVEAKRENLTELTRDTGVKGLKFIPGTGLIPGMANLKYSDKRRILTGLRRLEADYILMDLGAGTSATTLDFFTWADRGIIVTAPIPSAILNAYEFLKNAVYREIYRQLRSHPYARSIAEQTRNPNNEFAISTACQLADCLKDVSRGAAEKVTRVCEGMKLSLILNLADGTDAGHMIQKLQGIAKKFLSVTVEPLGEAPCDATVERLIRRLHPLTECPQDGGFFRSISAIARRLSGELSAPVPAPSDTATREAHHRRKEDVQRHETVSEPAGQRWSNQGSVAAGDLVDEQARSVSVFARSVGSALGKEGWEPGSNDIRARRKREGERAPLSRHQLHEVEVND